MLARAVNSYCYDEYQSRLQLYYAHLFSIHFPREPQLASGALDLLPTLVLKENPWAQVTLQDKMFFMQVASFCANKIQGLIKDCLETSPDQLHEFLGTLKRTIT